MRMSNCLAALLLSSAVWAVLMSLASPVQAAPIVFDEATGTASGDYSELGGPNDVGQFDLEPGVNQFFGSIVTPCDPSDVFNILIGSGQVLTDVAVDWGLNVTLFYPIAISQNTMLEIYRTSGTDDLLVLTIPLSYSPGRYSAPSSFELDPGLYNVLISSQVLALNSGAGPRYRANFEVVPEPSSAALLVLSLGVLWRRHKRRRNS